ncbi:hypothetical protein [Mycobacterium paragordonae]|jgi:hypothetical protein|uniref:hypothetical protein n=1 Tax=Mycobacterium paragordonae TaxID=1389713 RepID=UPI000A70252B|nr:MULTISPECIES: hypothetical protein [Mycobacterium]
MKQPEIEGMRRALAIVDAINRGESRRKFLQLDLAQAAEGEEKLVFSPGAARAYEQLQLTAEGGALLVHYVIEIALGMAKSQNLVLTQEFMMDTLGKLVDTMSKDADPGE